MTPDRHVGYSILRLMVVFIILISFCESRGAHLTPDQALQRVTGTTSMSMRRMPSKVSYELTYTEKTDDGLEVLYIFNKGDNGFIVTSADDRMTALLGYSDEGAFDLQTAPPAMRWWLGEYAKEANYLFIHEDEYNSNEYKATRSGTNDSEHTNIPVLLKTEWNQHDPYNLLCPIDDEGKRCMTGCVATAMAQIINYHQYPQKGTGYHTYEWNQNIYKGKLGGSFNYEETVFDYSKMLDIYKEDATEEEKIAVAQLMYACGVSVHMQYNPSESGAYDSLIAYALRTFFNYSDRIRYLMRNYFSTEEWEAIIYSELEANRPVIYSGNNILNKPHAFVCDGFQDGLFHINWGWGGKGNGYYNLSSLVPSYGYQVGYDSDQAITCGIAPINTDFQPWYAIYSRSSIEVESINIDELTDDKYVKIVISSLTPNGSKSYFINADAAPVNLNFYLRVEDENGENHFSDFGTPVSLGGTVYGCPYEGVETDNGCDDVTLKIPNLSPGTYKCYVSFSLPEGGWQDLIIPVGCFESILMNVDDNGNIEFLPNSGSTTEPEIKPDEKIEVSSLSIKNSSTSNSVITHNALTVLQCQFNNKGNIDYQGGFSFSIYKNDDTLTSVFHREENSFSLKKNEIDTYSFLIPYNFDIGDYLIIFYDKNGEIINQEFSFKVIEPVSGISLDMLESKMTEGETLQLTATVEPEDATDKSVLWTSSDEKVATVDENGLVTAISPGTTTITATSAGSSDIKANIVITVETGIIEVAGITLNAVEITATEGEEFSLYATINPENATVKTVKWGSSEPDIAQVDENGNVTALKPGTSVITAITANGFTASCKVIVEKRIIIASDISLNYSEMKITEGNFVELNVSFDPTTTTDQTIYWSSSDIEIVNVDDNGLVSALHPGNAVITAKTVNGVTATCYVTVEQKEISAENISLNVTDAIVEVGNGIILFLSFEPELTTDRTVIWSSSNPEIASVDENGGVLAIMPGKAVITATTSNGLTATCEITVEEREYEITDIFLNVTEATLTEEDMLALDIFVYPTIAEGKKVTWSSSSPEIASVDENGLVTAIKEGTATVTVSAENGVSTSCIIIVIRRIVEPTGIGIDNAYICITPGETFTITATVGPDDASDKTVIWTSSDEKVATVDTNGLVTAVSVGTAIITATTINGISVYCTVEVMEKVAEPDPTPEIIYVTSIDFDRVSTERLEKNVYVGDTFKLSVH